jgi:subtilisin family serine protease
MKAHPNLRASAEAAVKTGAGKLRLEAPPKFGGLLMDEAYPAIALPGTTPARASLEAAVPSRAPAFLTRGTIEVSKPEDIAFEQNGVQIFADPEVGLLPICPGDPPLGKAADVAKLLGVNTLKAKQLTGSGIAVAVVDTGINVAHLRGLKLKPKLDKTITIAPPGVPATPGAYPVNHGTMCAYDVMIAAPNCTLLDIPTLLSTTPGGSAMSGFLSDALRAFAYLFNQMRRPGWKYKALVVTNSWGMFHPSWDFPPGHPGRYADNPNHPFNIIAGTLAQAGADIVFAAGNCGADCPDGRCQNVVTNSITGANAHPAVMTVAGCDISDARVGYSSQGPGISGMAHDKPDITAQTHFLGSKAFGKTAPDSGTSAACPVAAGCVAALRTKRPAKLHPPPKIFDALRQTAKPAGGPVWNRDYGYGIIQPVAAAAKLGL